MFSTDNMATRMTISYSGRGEGVRERHEYMQHKLLENSRDVRAKEIQPPLTSYSG